MVANLILEAAKTAGMMSAGAAPTQGPPPVISQEKQDKMVQYAVDGPPGVLRALNKIVGKGGMVGINLSVSSLLRQSQLFTSTIGTTFQLIGAFLDITFAPFMPLIFRFMRAAAREIPIYGALVENTFNWFQQKWDWVAARLPENLLKDVHSLWAVFNPFAFGPGSSFTEKKEAIQDIVGRWWEDDPIVQESDAFLNMLWNQLQGESDGSGGAKEDDFIEDLTEGLFDVETKGEGSTGSKKEKVIDAVLTSVLSTGGGGGVYGAFTGPTSSSNVLSTGGGGGVVTGDISPSSVVTDSGGATTSRPPFSYAFIDPDLVAASQRQAEARTINSQSHNILVSNHTETVRSLPKMRTLGDISSDIAPMQVVHGMRFY